MKGGLFETLIISEFLKYRLNRGLESNLYFWRDKGGYEIDCLIDRAGTDLIPVEMKAGRTISGDYFKNIEYWNRLSGQKPERSFIVFGGENDQMRGQGHVIPYDSLGPIYELLSP